MITELYLTKDEQEKFSSFPAALRSGWQIFTEDLTCFETPRQLQMRAFMSDFAAHPEIAHLAKKIIDTPNQVSIEDLEYLSPDIQQEIYFIMGASGVDLIVKQLLSEAVDDDLLYALASMTTIRHKLLTLNTPTQI